MFYTIGMVKLVFDKKMLVKVNRGVISPRFRVLVFSVTPFKIDQNKK